MKLFQSTAFLALVTATPALADINVSDAWEMIRSSAEDAGMTVTVGDVRDNGDRLFANNVRYTLIEEGVGVAIHIDEMVFSAISGGKVELITSNIPVAITVEGPEGESVEILASIDAKSGRTVMSGTPEELLSEFNYPVITMTLDELIAEGEALPIEASFSASDVTGTQTYFAAENEDELAQQVMAYNVQSINMSASGADFEGEEGEFNMTASLQNLSGTGSGAIAQISMMGLPAEFESVSTLTRGALKANVSFSSPEGGIDIAISDQSGELNSELKDGILNYSSGSKGGVFNLMGNQMPIPPIDVSIAETSSSITVPMKPTPDAQDFGISMAVEGLQISDLLWSMADPFGKLPHDPADIRIDLSGNGRLLVDVFSPNFDPEDMTGAPGVLNSITLNELLLSVVGAKVTAEGSLTNIEENNLAIPTLVGSIFINASGINALIQSLGEMGLLPAQQAGFAQMMLGMFTVPGDAPDTLKTEIQLTEDGGILANGQRLQ